VSSKLGPFREYLLQRCPRARSATRWSSSMRFAISGVVPRDGWMAGGWPGRDRGHDSCPAATAGTCGESPGLSPPGAEAWSHCHPHGGLGGHTLPHRHHLLSVSYAGGVSLRASHCGTWRRNSSQLQVWSTSASKSSHAPTGIRVCSVGRAGQIPHLPEGRACSRRWSTTQGVEPARDTKYDEVVSVALPKMIYPT